MSRLVLRLFVVAIALHVGNFARSVVAQTFNDPTKVNVLREYFSDGTRAGSQSSAFGGGAGNQGIGSSDGSGNKTQASGFLTSGDTVQETYTLNQAQTVGSWNIQNLVPSRNATAMLLEGFVGGVWTTLDSFNPTASSSITRTFTPQTATALRYTASGPNVGGVDQFFQLFEMQVFLDSSDTQDLYGLLPTGSAYNYLRDRSPTISAPTTHNIVGSGWIAPDSTDISDWHAPQDAVSNVGNGDYIDVYRNQNTSGLTNPYSYAKISFTELLQMDLSHLGWYDGQDWNNWGLYASNLTTPNPDLASDWTTIFTSVGSTGQTELVNFGANAGMYQHLMVVFKSGNGGALTEVELYGFAPVPEPASAAMLGLGALAALACIRRRRKR